jgi:hypothetical protein
MGSLDAITGTTVYLDANVFIYHLEGFAQFTSILNRLFESWTMGRRKR